MQGLKNHFAIVDGRNDPFKPTAEEIIQICDPRTGVGAEQLLVIEPVTEAGAGAYARVRIYNPDGPEVEACGNATRCIARLFFDETGLDEIDVEINFEVLHCERDGDNYSVEMGKISDQWDKIPLAKECDTLHVDISDEGVSDGVAINVANPHLVYFVDDFDSVDLAAVGARIQKHPMLPESANVGLAEILDEDNIKFQVYERPGVLTQACGSGSCAVVAAAFKRGLIKTPSANVHMPGGSLKISYKDAVSPVMSGPAEYCYSGFLKR
ncbi:diaminopimelate epimerase [Pseudemcibacter aquimaris]|uniref:diaminopimelate epimerase n=1 Tax=Pseudemcibacter aquimaris TaxID=2857064 RepID=UPI002012A1E1|nr:diaminopimelate epimerase [Pseudemcibacter aquimaris]WDU58476.1 diaminopimelate epimerase [Pseudemcibacter aquimaris]